MSNNTIIIIGAGNTAPHNYVVKKGDTLSGIAAKYGMTVEEILKLNKQIKDPNLIHTGDEITIYDERMIVIREAIEMLKEVIE